MLELCNPELELVELVPRHEVELVGDGAERGERSLREPLTASADPARQLSDELLGRADARLGIPMRVGVSSLNLATAVAAVLFSTRA